MQELPVAQLVPEILILMQVQAVVLLVVNADVNRSGKDIMHEEGGIGLVLNATECQTAPTHLVVAVEVLVHDGCR